MKLCIARGLHAARRPLIAPRRLQRQCLVHPGKTSSSRWNSSSGAPTDLTNNLAALPPTNNSPSKESPKPIFITTPIFYVNGEPHIGHLYTLILADVIKRWHQMNGRQVFLSTGTDEHGSKMQSIAESEGLPPQVVCDTYSELFRTLADEGGVSYDAFIRTTDPTHKNTVSFAFNQLRNSLPQQLCLYKNVYRGWYSVVDECFYPESAVKTSLVPQTGQKIKISIETESEVEHISEETWFFPLSKYKQRLLDWYEKNPDWIVPKHQYDDIKKWVSENLQDLAVTRPLSRLHWGIRDPGDDKQTIYVWIDALINYLTVTGYGSKWNSREEPMGLWPPDLQIVGKDILRFHGVYWPAILMALNLPLPKKILSHDHWTMSKRKMSKSVGNVVNPFFAIQRWDVDPLRYCMLRSSNYNRSMDYANASLGMFYIKELQASLGNLLYRVTRPKVNNAWSPKVAVEHFANGSFDQYMYHREPERQFDTYRELTNAFMGIDQSFDGYMECGNVPAALRLIFDLLLHTNAFLSQSCPWQLLKSERERGRILLNWIIFNAAEATRVAAIMLQPVMPEKTKMILDELGVAEDRRTREWGRKYQDSKYGQDSLALPSVTSLLAQGIEPTQRRFRKWDAIFPPTMDTRVTDKRLSHELETLAKAHNKNPDAKNMMYQMTELMAIQARMETKNKVARKAAKKGMTGEDESAYEPWPEMPEKSEGQGQEFYYNAESVEEIKDEPEPIHYNEFGEPLPRYKPIKGHTLSDKFHVGKKPKPEGEAHVQKRIDERRRRWLETPLGREWSKKKMERKYGSVSLEQ